MDPKDIYIVIDKSPRAQCIVLATFDRDAAIAEQKVCQDDYVILQPSGKEYREHWRF